MALGYDGSIRIDTKINSRGFNTGISSMTASLRKLAGVIGIAFGVAAIVNFGRESVKAASQLSSALIGLQSIVEGQGRSFQQAQGFINDYIKDGLVPMQDAVTAYKNLAMRGYSTEQIEKTMVALKDASAFGRNASMSMGDAVSSASEGLKNENSLLVDNAGVTKNVAKMWDDYAKSIGTTSNKLTQQQKIQAEVNGILEESKYQVGDAAKVTNTYAGQMSMLSFNFTQLKVAVGNAIMPIVQAVLPGINAIISALTTLANIFAQVTSLLFGGGGMKAQAGTQKEIASSAGSAAGATDDLASATGGMGDASKKAAKDMKGVTAGFDDLNVLASSAADSLDSAAGAVGGLEAPDFGDGGAGEMWGDVEINPEIAAFVDGLKDSFARLNEALGPTKEALAGLWEQLKIVAGFAWDGMKGFYENFLVPVGAWVLGEGIPRFVTAIKDGLAAIDWQKINDALNSLWEAIAPFAINVGEGLLWLWENVLVPLGTWTMNEVVPLFLLILSGAIDSLNQIIEFFKPAASWLWENLLKPIAEWTGGVIVTVLEEISDIMWLLTPIILGAATAILALNAAVLLAKTAMALFNLVASANPVYLVVAAVGALIGLLVALAMNWDKVKEVAAAAWDKIKEVWNTASEWIDTNVIQPIAGFFSGLWDGVKSAASTAWDEIKKVWSAVSGWFDKNIITPITTAFKGFMNGLIGFVEGFVNFFIRGINAIIGGFNKLSIKIPDNPITGAVNLGFNIPKIPNLNLPRLANGAVIPPNQQFAAILGDQRSGVNIETPLSTMVQAFESALSKGGYGGGNSSTTVILNADGKTLARVVVPHINDMTRSAGKPVLLI